MRIERFTPSAAAIHDSGERIVSWQIGRIRPTPSHVPPGWRLVRLTSVARLESGHTPARGKPEYWDGGIPWISLHDTETLDENELFRTEQTVSEEGLAHSSARLLPRGTVVFSRTATVGKSSIMGREMATSQDFANYVCGKDLSNRYLMYLFRFMGPEWRRLMAGSTHNTVYMPVFEALQILLPPISEQEAIAGALSDADALIESLEGLIAKKRQIKTGAMQELLTGKTRLPGFGARWEAVTLDTCFELVNTRNAERDDNVVTISARSGFVRQEEFFSKRVASSMLDNYYLIRRGDFAYNRSSSNGYPFGAIKRLTQLPKAVVTTLYICFRPRETAGVHPEFYEHYFEAGLMNSGLSQVTNEGARIHGLLNIGKSDFMSLEIVHPCQEEQSTIAAILSDMDAELAALETNLAKVRQIKQGMMQELLTGRIRLVNAELRMENGE